MTATLNARDPAETADPLIDPDAPASPVAPDPGSICRRILVPVDGSPLAAAALPAAAALAHRTGAGVTLVHAVEPVHVPDVSESLARQLGETDSRFRLQRAADRLAKEGVPAAELLVVPHSDDPADTPGALLTAIEATTSDLVVMTTHGRTGAARALLGSVAEALIRRASVPILVFGRHAAEEAETWPELASSTLPPCIVLALSGDPASEAVLERGTALARALDAGVELVRVVPEPRLLLGAGYGARAARDATEEYLARQAEVLLRARPTLRFVRTAALVAAPDRVASTIVEHARWNGALAIAMATRGRSGLARLLLGSVTASVVATASAPVLVVPPAAA